MEKGKFYKSKISNTIVMCTKESEKGVFCGLVISSNQLYYPKGYYDETWKDFIFEEISPDQVPGYHTSVKNTHPTTEDFNKLQAIGPQGQIAETKRRDFWCRTVIAYTGAANSVDVNKCIAWADHCLEQFDKRFNNK